MHRFNLRGRGEQNKSEEKNNPGILPRGFPNQYEPLAGTCCCNWSWLELPGGALCKRPRLHQVSVIERN